jgi:hypothetical protein
VVPDHRQLARLDLLEETILHDLFRAQLVAAMNERDVRGDVREVDGFLDRGIAAADDGHAVATEEKSVAGRAGGDAVATMLFLGRQPEVLGGGAGGDDERVARVGRRIAAQGEGPGHEVRGGRDRSRSR